MWAVFISARSAAAVRMNPGGGERMDAVRAAGCPAVLGVSNRTDKRGPSDQGQLQFLVEGIDLCLKFGERCQHSRQLLNCPSWIKRLQADDKRQ